MYGLFYETCVQIYVQLFHVDQNNPKQGVLSFHLTH